MIRRYFVPLLTTTLKVLNEEQFSVALTERATMLVNVTKGDLVGKIASGRLIIEIEIEDQSTPSD